MVGKTKLPLREEHKKIIDEYLKRENALGSEVERLLEALAPIDVHWKLVRDQFFETVYDHLDDVERARHTEQAAYKKIFCFMAVHGIGMRPHTPEEAATKLGGSPKTVRNCELRFRKRLQERVENAMKRELRRK